VSDTFRLQVKSHFDSAHYLKGYLGKCQRLHGHRWEVEFCFEGGWLNDMNMLIDFALVKELMDKFIEELDHYLLNDQLKEENPTAEFIARWFFLRMQGAFRNANMVPLNHTLLDAVKRGVKVVRVCVWETPECCVKFYQESEA
jgi:6-pyruvoyltetrahydropterin/6-carboxytetrahydropterin synthase